MRLLQPIYYFFWGILKRFYYWMPFVILDVPELWQRYLEPFASASLGWELKMPDTLTMVVPYSKAFKNDWVCKIGKVKKGEKRNIKSDNFKSYIHWGDI